MQTAAGLSMPAKGTRHHVAAVFTASTARGHAGDPEFRRRVRPLRPGYSFGLSRNVGTLGLVVATADAPAYPLLLSSSHVLNRRADGRVYPLYQPAGCDRFGEDRPVARALRYTRLDRSGWNLTEAGLAAPESTADIDPRHPLGLLRGVARTLTPGQRLFKVGRTTGEVRGKVLADDWHGRVKFRNASYRFAHQVVVESDVDGPVALDGDSGGVWLTEDREVAALHFAGSADGRLSIASPMGRVLRTLGVGLFEDATIRQVAS